MLARWSLSVAVLAIEVGGADQAFVQLILRVPASGTSQWADFSAQAPSTGRPQIGLAKE
jgi:hypothetical protein